MTSINILYETFKNIEEVLEKADFIAAFEPFPYDPTHGLNCKDFSQDFVFGVGSAAYQYEGATKEGGRGPSIWDSVTERNPGKVKHHSHGTVAVDSYGRYKEDVRLLKEMGVDSYRFSISWSRILPSGRLGGGVNREGVKYYNNLIDELLANGIKPSVTLFHFDLPQALEDEYGGFLSPRIVEDFRDYARVCFWEFGDRVKHWVTFNEPYSYCFFGYATAHMPPFRGSRRESEKTVDSIHLLSRLSSEQIGESIKELIRCLDNIPEPGESARLVRSSDVRKQVDLYQMRQNYIWSFADFGKDLSKIGEGIMEVGKGVIHVADGVVAVADAAVDLGKGVYEIGKDAYQAASKIVMHVFGKDRTRKNHPSGRHAHSAIALPAAEEAIQHHEDHGGQPRALSIEAAPRTLIADIAPKNVMNSLSEYGRAFDDGMETIKQSNFEDPAGSEKFHIMLRALEKAVHKASSDLLQAQRLAEELYKENCEVKPQPYKPEITPLPPLPDDKIMEEYNEDPGREPYIAAHHMLLAHAAAVHMYRTYFQPSQKGKIGITMLANWFEPLRGKRDEEVRNRALDFFIGWFMQPLTRGEYPDIMKSIVGDRLPQFTVEEAVLLQHSYDFIGVQYYTTDYATERIPRRKEKPHSMFDHGATFTALDLTGKPIGPRCGSHWLHFYPQGIQKVLKFIKENYDDPEIYITENGCSELDNLTLPVPKALNDHKRIVYHKEHLYYIHQAMAKDGVKVRGYFAWSFLDNFELNAGYSVRFGMVYVDHKHGFARYPKLSALWYKSFLKDEPDEKPSNDQRISLLLEDGPKKSNNVAMVMHNPEYKPILKDEPEKTSNDQTVSPLPNDGPKKASNEQMVTPKPEDKAFPKDELQKTTNGQKVSNASG